VVYVEECELLVGFREEENGKNSIYVVGEREREREGSGEVANKDAHI